MTVRTRFARPREELEERLISEWASQVHPRARVTFRARLGPLPEKAYALKKEGISPKMYTVVRHWADAIVQYPNRLIVVEGKIKLKPEAVGQLLLARQLLPQTPEYQNWHSENVDYVIVYAIGDPETEALCRLHGIKTIRFTPKWAIDAYTARKAGIEAIH